MNAERKQCNANRPPGFDADRACAGAPRVSERMGPYEGECFKIQVEIVDNASGANVSSIARDSAGKPR